MDTAWIEENPKISVRKPASNFFNKNKNPFLAQIMTFLNQKSILYNN